MKRVEPAHLDPSLDRPGSQPRREQLLSADHPMLLLGKARDHGIPAKVAYLSPYTGVNQATLAHTPDRGSRNATELTPSMPKFEHHSPNTLITNRLSRPPSNSA